MGTQVRYHAPRDSLAVHNAEKQKKFKETFYASFNNSVRLLLRSPSRSSRDATIPRRTKNSQAAGRMGIQGYDCSRDFNRSSNSETRDARNQATFICYDCQGLEHFATRGYKGRKTLLTHGQEEAQEGVQCVRSTPRKTISCRERESERERDELGIRVEDERGGSSFHFSVPDDVAATTPCSILLEQGTPTLSVKIEEMPKNLIIDKGSNVSILHLGVEPLRENYSDQTARRDGGSP